MNSLLGTLKRLQERLPELEWKLNNLNISLNEKILPTSLFKAQLEVNSKTCIEEINSDLERLKRQNSESSAAFLAANISRKVHVLSKICNRHHESREFSPTSKMRFDIQTIGNRQQWLQDLQEEIQRLSQQQQALKNALEVLQRKGNPQAVLNAQRDLGEITRCLTLAQEALIKSSNF